jgi:hypothetical protein
LDAELICVDAAAADVTAGAACRGGWVDMTATLESLNVDHTKREASL